jgi:hypothetical protein
MTTTGATVLIGLGSGARRACVMSAEIYFQSVFGLMSPRLVRIVRMYMYVQAHNSTCTLVTMHETE